MAKIWVLDTDTKGTGAEMVPLEQAQKRAGSGLTTYVPRAKGRRRPETPEPKRPARFRVVDVMTREALVEDAGARATVDALRDVRSVVDVDVYTRSGDAEPWRRLTLSEQKALWAYRDR